MITLVCSCMNRTKALTVSYSSWLEREEITNILIVDWSSTTAIEDELNFIHKNTSIIRVEGETQFSLGRAYNTALEHVTTDQVLKMDVDYCMSTYNNYFEYNKLLPGEFITGDHRIGTLRDENGFIRYLNGMIHAWTDDVIKVRGYNEQFVGYGFDDEDLYDRLTETGRKRRYMTNKPVCMFHLPHEDNVRTEHYKTKNKNWSSNHNFRVSGRTSTHKIDNMVCVSLESDSYLYQPFEKLGIRRFAAIDSRGDNKFIYRDHGLKLHPGSVQQDLYFSESPGAVGCFLTHMSIWKQIVENQTPVTLITEDDADVDDLRHFLEMYDYISYSGKYHQYDVIQLNKRSIYPCTFNSFNGTESYIITNTGAQRLLNNIHDREGFNNLISDKPTSMTKQQWGVFRREPPQNWNVHQNCIVAAVDKFIGMSGTLSTENQNHIKIKTDPHVGLHPRRSTIFDHKNSRFQTDFWNLESEGQLNRLTLEKNFKWWCEEE